jgi:hypothetical protein
MLHVLKNRSSIFYYVRLKEQYLLYGEQLNDPTVNMFNAESGNYVTAVVRYLLCFRYANIKHRKLTKIKLI